MDEQKLTKEFEAYQQLHNQDKKIDVATLMIQALARENQNQLTPKEKRWAYLISISLPPFGLIFAVKFYLSDKSDSKEAALLCVVLTAASILLFVLLGAVLLGGSGTSLKQIQSITPNQIQQTFGN